MIYSLIHPGSGIGNQLFRYVAGKVMARDRFEDYSAIGRGNFKGESFMDLDFGLENDIRYRVEMPAGKIVITEPDINGYIIDDEFQSPLFWQHRLDEVDKWLKVEPINIPDGTCVIGFRGGEFAVYSELFLRRDYWDDAIERMQSIGVTNFEVHTDDPNEMLKLFPHYKVIQDISINWRSIRYAKHLIISNSAFGILPALLNENAKMIIAPRYWSRRNIKQWISPQNYYKKFSYL